MKKENDDNTTANKANFAPPLIFKWYDMKIKTIGRIITLHLCSISSIQPYFTVLKKHNEALSAQGNGESINIIQMCLFITFGFPLHIKQAFLPGFLSFTFFWTIINKKSYHLFGMQSSGVNMLISMLSMIPGCIAWSAHHPHGTLVHMRAYLNTIVLFSTYHLL